MKRLTVSLLIFSCASSLLPLSLHAEAPPAPKLEFPAASPAVTLKQRVGVTDVELNYSQPSVRGRKIFGTLEPFGKVWRTGANNATKISFSTAVKLNGTEIPAGAYELFTIPDAAEWTVIIHKAMSQWGAYTYDQKNDVARIKAKPVRLAEPVETLLIHLTEVRDDSAELCIDWETTRVPVKLEVDTVGMMLPKIDAVMASGAPKKPYVQAALFYYEHNLDLKKALGWIDAAAATQPEAFYFQYQKARILAKMGDKEGARAAAKKSLEGANKAEGAIKEEYVRLNEALIGNLK